MANENKTTKDAYKNLFAAEVAAQVVEQNPDLASMILYEMKLPREAEILIQGLDYLSTPEGTKKTADIFAKESELSRKQTKISELYSFYKKTPNISAEASKKIEFLYNQFGDKTLGSVLGEVEKAQITLKLSQNENLKSKFNEEEITSAKKTLEKYGTFMGVYQTMHSQMISEVQFGATQKASNMGLEEIVKDVKLPAPEKK